MGQTRKTRVGSKTTQPAALGKVSGGHHHRTRSGADGMTMADDELVFQAGAFSVVSSWLLGEGDDDKEQDEQQPPAERERRPVQLYRAASTTDKPSLSGRSFGAGGDSMLSEEQRELKRKVLRRPGGPPRSTAERLAASAKQAAEEAEKALDMEEQELVRYKAETLSAPTTTSTAAGEDANASDAVVGKKRKLTAQEELLEKLREEAARKKAKNLKAKLRQQRKKQKQSEQQQ